MKSIPVTELEAVSLRQVLIESLSYSKNLE
jgi:hypothetical protein